MDKLKAIAASLTVMLTIAGCGVVLDDRQPIDSTMTAETILVTKAETTTVARTTQVTTSTTVHTTSTTSTTTRQTTVPETRTETQVSILKGSPDTHTLIETDCDSDTFEEVTELSTETGTEPVTDDSMDYTLTSEESSVSDTSWCDYITEYERELIAEVVEHEAGSDSIGCYDKACCVAAIMNRVRSGNWGGSDVYSVLSAPGQFSGFYPGYRTPRSGAYEAVDYYFSHQSEFSTTITSWWGDGKTNHFS